MAAEASTEGSGGAVVGRVVHQKGRGIAGEPKETDFDVGPVTVEALGAGEVRVVTEWVSVDPCQKVGMRTPWSTTEVAGGPNTGACVGRVVASACDRVRVGCIVRGRWGWRDVANVRGGDVEELAERAAARPSAALGVLGMPGRAAYFGLFKILKPTRGQTLFVSGGAGCVGSCVAQMAKAHFGCVVYGSTIHASKVDWMESVGYEKGGVLDGYYADGPEHYAAALKKMIPQGVDLYLDCVGGELSEGVWRLLNDGARVAVCGQMAYACERRATLAGLGALYPTYGAIAGLWNLATKTRASLYNLKIAEVVNVRCLKAAAAAAAAPGAVVAAPETVALPDGKSATYEAYAEARFFAEAHEAEAFIADMIDRGDLKYQEDVEIGDLDVIPGQFCKLFHGSNHGKALVKIDAKVGAEIKAKRAADRAERVRQREAEDEEARRLEAAEKAEAMAEAKAAS